MTAAEAEWHRNEMRKFANEIQPEFGPFFGRDVVLLLNEHEKALAELARKDAALRAILAQCHSERIWVGESTRPQKGSIVQLARDALGEQA